MKTYDIVNAGPKNRFMANGRIVSNSGRLIQLQNLPKNFISDLKEARETVKSGDFELMNILYDNIPDTLSQLIRTAFIPSENKKFIVADFSAIEARVIAWLAGEEWRVKLFEDGGDIYCQSASQMFGVPVEKNGINGHLRQKGKIAELACIAEGQPVLTDRGLVPIEKVTLSDKLWDGEEWVTHEGVIYKGEREVICYDGLTATADHLVWVEGKSQPIQFGKAATSEAHLIQTGDGGRAIRLGENYISRKKVEQGMESLFCFNKMPRLWLNTMAELWKSQTRKIKGLSAMFSAKKNTKMVRPKINSSKTKMRKSQRQGLSQLWSKRNKVRFSKCNRGRFVFNQKIWNAKESIGNRQDKQQWQLCSGEYKICFTQNKQSKQKRNCINPFFSGILALLLYNYNKKIIPRNDKKRNYRRCLRGGLSKEKELEVNRCKVRLYDIRNAGRNHRFTVSGKLVHNCGYGDSGGALKAMGALEMGLTEDELQPLVSAWRESNPNIVNLWWDIDEAVKRAIKERSFIKVKCLRIFYRSGILFIELPSGRCLSYIKPKIGENKFGGESVTYEGIGATKKWERLESYGPKFVENIIQGIARDLLMYSMQTLKDCRIVAHVHDELIIEADEKLTLDEVCEQMGKTPPWAKGLNLKADGYECEFYKKE